MTATSTAKHRLASANIRLAAPCSPKRFPPTTALRLRGTCLQGKAVVRPHAKPLTVFDRQPRAPPPGKRNANLVDTPRPLQIAVAPPESHLVSLSPHHLQELGLLQQESEALAPWRPAPAPARRSSLHATGSSLEHLTPLAKPLPAAPVSLNAVCSTTTAISSSPKAIAGQRKHHAADQLPSARKR